MRKISILSGNFSAAGNYSGYNASGERVFIAKRQMESLGFKTDADVKFPFYCLAQNKEYEEQDENGQPTGNKFTRLTAGSVFGDKTKMINASIEDRLLDIEAEVALKAQATSAGLTEAQLLALA
jgi:hypothetical protein